MAKRRYRIQADSSAVFAAASSGQVRPENGMTANRAGSVTRRRTLASFGSGSRMAWRLSVVWLARSRVYRHQAPTPDTPPERRGPMGPMSDEDLTTAIRAVLAASPIHGEGHRKVWARLRCAGISTSLSRVLRLIRENDLLAPGRVGLPRGPHSHDGTIIPETVEGGTDLRPRSPVRGWLRGSSRWIIAPPNASASMPMRAPTGSRHWITFGRNGQSRLTECAPYTRRMLQKNAPPASIWP